jgi:hypothetical protein
MTSMANVGNHGAIVDRPIAYVAHFRLVQLYAGNQYVGEI